MIFCSSNIIVLRCRSYSLQALLLCLHISVHLVATQTTQTKHSIDPDELAVLNYLSGKWDLSESAWKTNICNYSEFNNTYKLDGPARIGIRCDCSYDNNSTCHITELVVVGKDIHGEIPEDLRSLPYLQRLNLAKNYLNGTLPAFLGNFPNMTRLSVMANSLSGPIPKEIGNLSKLEFLYLGHNNFSGVLPPELGNLVNLQGLFLSSSGLGGDIPSTFASLQNLQIVYLRDNNFTGKIPDFIGGWTKLTELRLHGNSFQGAIPSNFANLTSLKKLYIGEVNGSSSLAFINNMTRLKHLVIRNSMISGTLPDNFDKFENLSRLDLSFNNISGSIPKSLFDSKTLKYLLLGNNSLSGNLPSEKSSNLKNIDVSYNKISGRIPSWVGESNVNLVANNFAENDIKSVASLPEGLNCLQQDQTCKDGKSSHFQFGINCGGKKFKASNGTVYEYDGEKLGEAVYFESNTENWAVSNVGVFQNDEPPKIIKDRIPLNTSDVELFQNLRFSTSSLRYYGLGLQDGSYNVTLQFIELTFANNRSWRSLGRRVFDIYIQGELKQKDFDITKEAGGVSTVVKREYTAHVKDNLLEIHLFWAGKGTHVIPATGNYGPSIAAVRVKPNFTKGPSDSNKALVAGIASGIAIVFLLVLGIVMWMRRKRAMADGELEGLAIQPCGFRYSELRSATGHFSTANKLGEGGFGAVYKGKLSDGRLVAVKKLSNTSHHGAGQFAAEIASLSAVQHRNLVKLYGCCYERGRKLLVYEYLENKSLDRWLFGSNELHLDWPTRFKICLGTARGLAYLHEESRLRIIHRDIKVANILLDGELNPKISDFGLARLYDDDKTHISTKIAGTLGYLPPEYAMKGRLTEKADVFAFGIVALEIVSGRRNADPSLDEERMYLLEWAWQMHRKKCEVELVDQSLQTFNEEEIVKVIKVALLCTQATAAPRPTMSQVVGMLVGDFEVDDVKSRPAYITDYTVGDSGIINPSTSPQSGLVASFATSKNESLP